MTNAQRGMFFNAKRKKESKNFACKFDKAIFDRLEEYCQVSRLSKTAVVERAVEKYLDENMEIMREVAKRL